MTVKYGRWRIAVTPAGNFAINGRLYGNLQDAMLELERLDAKLRQARKRRQPIVRDFAREQRILQGVI